MCLPSLYPVQARSMVAQSRSSKPAFSPNEHISAIAFGAVKALRACLVQIKHALRALSFSTRSEQEPH